MSFESGTLLDLDRHGDDSFDDQDRQPELGRGPDFMRPPRSSRLSLSRLALERWALDRSEYADPKEIVNGYEAEAVNLDLTRRVYGILSRTVVTGEWPSRERSLPLVRRCERGGNQCVVIWLRLRLPLPWVCPCWWLAQLPRRQSPAQTTAPLLLTRPLRARPFSTRDTSAAFPQSVTLLWSHTCKSAQLSFLGIA